MKPEDQIVVLKSKLFDAAEEIQLIQAQSKQFQDALVAIAAKLGLTGDSITLESILEAVPAPEQQIELPLE